MSMSVKDALVVLRDARRDEDVVVTTMGAAREWMALGSHPLVLVFVPSSMGQATSVGLGLALAQPQRRVIVCNGDGSMLMNLGSLVSITAAAPANLIVILFDNGIYEVTGSQPTPGAPAGRAEAGAVDFTLMARACGFRSVFGFLDCTTWTDEVGRVLAMPGPTFVALDITAVENSPGPRSPGPAGARAKAFMTSLEGPP